MTTTQPFQPTHEITHNGRRILVENVDGVLYTIAEWKTDSAADWELTSDGFLRFQGQIPPGESSFRTIPNESIRACPASSTGYVALMPYAAGYDAETLTAEDIAHDPAVREFDPSNVSDLVGLDGAWLRDAFADDPDSPEHYAVEYGDEILGAGATPDAALADARDSVAGWDYAPEPPELDLTPEQQLAAFCDPRARLVHTPGLAEPYNVMVVPEPHPLVNLAGETVHCLASGQTAADVVTAAIKERGAMRLEARAEVTSAIAHSLRTGETYIMPWTDDRCDAAEKLLEENDGGPGRQVNLPGVTEYHGARGWRIALERGAQPKRALPDPAALIDGITVMGARGGDVRVFPTDPLNPGFGFEAVCEWQAAVARGAGDTPAEALLAALTGARALPRK